MPLPDQIQVMAISEKGPNARLIAQSRPMPTLSSGEVLIRVAYAGLNHADLFQRAGHYDPPAGVTDISGLECSGTIVACGPDVTQWKTGTEICALLAGGGYADYVVAKADHCLSLPTGLSLQQAAALPECVITVWMALFEEAGLKPHESVLIHGGTSGIGTFAIQMVRAWGGTTYALASSDAKAQLVASLGGVPIRYDQCNYAETIKDTGGVDIVLDMVGGDTMQRNLSCLKPYGRLISLAFLQGAKAELSMGGLLMKQLRWQGVTLRARSDAHKAHYIRQVQKIVWPWIANQTVRPVIDSVYALHDVEAAQAHMQKRLHLGKILLQVSP